MTRTRSPAIRASSVAQRILAAIMLAGILQGCAPVIVAGAAAGAAVVHDRRTLGSMVNDTTVELKATGILDTEPQFKGKIHVSVTSVNGIVLLTGQAPTPDLRDQILAKIRTIPSIRRIINEIQIAPPSTLADRAEDAWITTEVKARFLATKGLDPTRVKVVTSDSNVYLMGLVRQQEGQLATNAAANVRGVARVVELFEYVN
ncbi:MAG: BON domain-containing protein [Acidiferrobacterales bacterium]